MAGRFNTLLILAGTLLISFALLAFCDAAVAQLAHHPFAVGASEGAVGHQNAVGAWLLGQESRFYLGLTQAVRAARTSAAGALGLIGLSFAYGVFHAAGPGHGKAVITSYLMSNEVALRRGLLISLLAALLQGLIATMLVGIAAFVFGATAQRMTATAETIEFGSYLGIVGLGAFLCWRKGWALLVAVWPEPVAPSLIFATPPVTGVFHVPSHHARSASSPTMDSTRTATAPIAAAVTPICQTRVCSRHHAWT